MSGNDDHDSSESASTATLGRSGLATSGQGEHGADRSADVDAAARPPPLGVKLTGYRLLNITTVFCFGSVKGILTYMGQSTAPTTLDWVGGALLAVVLYWIGLYEQRDTKKWEWFFQVDLAPAIGYYTKRVVGGFMWPWFCFDGLFVFVYSLGPLVITLVFYLHDLHSSRALHSYPPLVVVSLIIVIYGCMLLPWYCTRRVRVRVWALQRAMRFVDEYGPGAPLAQRYWWFGAVGTVVGLFCGIAVVGLPWAMHTFYVP